MSDIKLFRLSSSGVSELQGATLPLERSLQTIFERHLDGLLGIRFLASEYRTTNGRIDTLGIDENYSGRYVSAVRIMFSSIIRVSSTNRCKTSSILSGFTMLDLFILSVQHAAFPW